MQTTEDIVRERTETFTLRLSNASSNAAIDDEDGTATGAIEDDDNYVSKGQIKLTLAPAEVREDAGTNTEVSVVASVDSSPDAAVTVSLALSGTATEGTDYTVSGTQSITIAAGATSDETALTFTPINDGAYEGDETIRITGTATGYTSGSTTLTLADDEKPPPPPSGGGGGSPPPPPPPPPPPFFDDETIAAQFYIQGTAIDPLVFPIAEDGTKPLTYGLSQTSTAQAAIDPLTGLPDSLAFDPKTRTLSGIPATPLPATEFSYTVIDADGRTASPLLRHHHLRPHRPADSADRPDCCLRRRRQAGVALEGTRPQRRLRPDFLRGAIPKDDQRFVEELGDPSARQPLYKDLHHRRPTSRRRIQRARPGRTT